MVYSLGDLTFRQHLALSEDTQEIVLQLQAVGILNKNAVCKCGREMSMQKRADKTDGITWRCPSHQCGKRRSIRESSYFANHRLPLGKKYGI
jgi:hypothetical protein